MKKFLTALSCAILAAACCLSFGACGGDNSDEVTVYMPDGAPALAAAQLMAENPDLGKTVSYNVVDSGVIATYVSYEDESKNADLCILPVNAAAAKLGSGDSYQLVGTVTHGNLYIVSKNYTDVLTASTLSTLVGKSVGVVNLSNVPGLTFKAILTDNSVGYTTVGDDNLTSTDKVNLYNINSDSSSVASTLSANQYDYYVVPEPAATAQSNRLSLNRVGNLQELYGGTNGYPQAVLIAKKSLIKSDPDFITAFCDALTANQTWIKTASAETIVNAINAHITEGSISSLSVNNLNSTVIENCAINFVSAVNSRTEILIYLSKIGASTPSDSFFYAYTA